MRFSCRLHGPLHSTTVLTACACRLSVVCFWTIRASVKMCDYVVNDKQRYNTDASIMEVCACSLRT